MVSIEYALIETDYLTVVYLQKFDYWEYFSHQPQ